MNSIKISLVVVIVLGLFVAVWCSAAVVTTPEGAIVTHYPAKFDGIGIIDSIEKRGIVVDDMFLPFSPHARYMTPSSEYSSIRAFSRGQKIGYLLNDKHQIKLLCALFR